VKQGLLSTSYRRRRLDRDLAEACGSLQGLALDLGGEWQNRRGTFLLPQHTCLRWMCFNVDTTVAPDVVADIAHVPIASECADTVVCTEVLEHVPSPQQVLAETYRLLRPGGQLIASMPFLSRIHNDPNDYQRYTAAKLSDLLSATGFHDADIQPQGLYFSVLADVVRSGLARLKPALVRWLLALVVRPLLNWSIQREGRTTPSRFISSYVSGYFIVARKPD
jgi:SAM-dependent methyltransferase